MRTSDAVAIVALAIGLPLAGCSTGCDGERAQKVSTPHVVSPGTTGQPAVVEMQPPAPPATVELPPVPPGALDAPPGSLDGLYSGLAAAERGDPTARVDVVFFGDSHTAGDSMTERLRLGWQA